MDENNQEIQKFYIGVDVGTESVGFAATDANYNVIKKFGKPCMGARLFSEGQTARERRVIRANKVRKQRGKFRITLLQELFEKEIKKVDPLFYIRLKASSFWQEDKANKGLATLNSLFADKTYVDKHHFSKFKTIYHLRKFLTDEKNWTDNIPDIRFIYLACNHILKSRGHFLKEGEFNLTDAGVALFKNLNEYLIDENENGEDELPYIPLMNLDNFSKIEDTAKNNKLRLKEKKEKIKEALCLGNDKRLEKIAETFLGFKVKLTDIFIDYQNFEEFNQFSLSGDWEILAPQFVAVLGDDFKLIEILKEIYDWFTLTGFLKGHGCLSEAMIDKYNKHSKDLNLLKKVVKDKAKDKYYKIFRSNEEKCNYAAFIGSNLSNGKSIIKKCEQKDFYDFLKKELSGLLTEEMIADIENHNFLPKLRTKDNSTIPYQLHELELKKILLNASKHYRIDSKKVLSLLTFKVPYYVGRLNGYYKDFPEDKAHHVWIEKREEYKNKRTTITPWNFSEIVDLDNSGKNFITRMLSKCTYLENETVLPKNSLCYSTFVVLNELNNLKIKSEPVSVELKKQIFNELFKTQKKVTVSKLLMFLGNGIEKSDISGIDLSKGFNSSLSSYIQAKKIFGDKIEDEKTKKIVEDVILWQALFTDKVQVESRIKTTYPNLTSNEIKELKGLNFSGFGRLSKRFLLSPSVICYDAGEARQSILDLLWETNENLMEIIHNKNYNISDWLKDENSTEDENITYADIQDSYAAPSVKRAVWQTMLIVDELIETNGKQPDKIFIEVTRSGRVDKKPTNSRKKQLLDNWGNGKNFEELKKELELKSDSDLRGDKLYLYFLQCGKCAYSGESINISDIYNDNLYDIDHIIPQSLKKDDSLNNKVLAKRDLNAKKDKWYPLNKTPEIWSKKDNLIKMWETWNKYQLISEEKLQRLKRTTEITPKELEGFIARQLVFTGQSATIAADLLGRKYPDAEIVYSKAENVSDFRKKFDILKCRDVNDFHHAHDAYLNIVVGNTFNQRYNHNKNFYINKYQKTDETWKTYTQNRLFEENVADAWKINESIETVKKNLSYNNLLVTKKTQENKGEFYKQTIYSSLARQKEIFYGRKSREILNSENNLIPRKGLKLNPISDVSKYGGFKTLRPAYFLIVEYSDKKGERVREFTTISLLDKKRWESLTDVEQLNELSKKFNNPKIISKILIYSLFKIGKMECRLSGWNGNNVFFHNAKQWFIDKENSDYMRIISKYNEMVKTKKIKPDDFLNASEISIIGGSKKDSKIQKLTKECNQKLWKIILEKLDKLYSGMENLKGKSLGLPDLYDRLNSRNEEFINLSIVRQLKVLSGLITGLGCNASAFDLSELSDDGKKDKEVCKIQPSVKINYPLTLINQSITGLKEKHIKIYPFTSEE